MRTRRVGVIHNFAAGLIVTALFAGCGGATATPVPTGPTPKPTASPKPTPSPPPTISQSCADELEGLLESLEELDGRLDVGLTYVAYGERVGDVSVAYNRVDLEAVKGMGLDCVSTGALLENAFNEYIKAHNAWRDCFDRTGCTNDSVKPTLQAHWATATQKIDAARATFP